MRRRSPDEQVREYRERYTRPEGDDLRERLTDWSAVVADQVGDPWPDMPEGVSDRAADVWEPLLMVADLAGGDWPERARAACVAFVTAARDETPSRGIQLLKDLYTIFEPEMPDAIPTETILAELHAMDESPWGDWYGKPLDARRLAKLLKPYGIKPKLVRIGDSVSRGYRREELWDEWKRYGILSGGSVTDATCVTALIRPVTHVASVTDKGNGDGGSGHTQSWDWS